MTERESAVLRRIDDQAAGMVGRLIAWANINTGTTNLGGLKKFRGVLRAAMQPLGAEVSEIELAPMETIGPRGELHNVTVGKALSAIKRPEAALRVLLCIHMDTVYGADHPFQVCKQIDEATLNGPGVADAKGGLLVMLTALAAVEEAAQSDPRLAEKIGWEVLINPDEEVGSISSAPLLAAAAERNHVGLLFEPALADGALVDRRKGSGNFSVVVRGKAAHAGRDFALGRNAVVAAAGLAMALDGINSRRLSPSPCTQGEGGGEGSSDVPSGVDESKRNPNPNPLPEYMERGPDGGVTLNIGSIDGGGPSNIVPDFALLRFNVRTTAPEDEPLVLKRIREAVATANLQEGIKAELHGGFHCPAKIPDARGRALMDVIARCGGELNLPMVWRNSGGACDGNKLAAAGLANVDTLGPCGGELHSPREFVLVKTLAERAKLTALVLMRLAETGMPA
ncbi:MAG: M20/M25/M40 family metallo-hydrolase [Tepidisphaeraceae bacterium]